jgi:hypothetical protein
MESNDKTDTSKEKSEPINVITKYFVPPAMTIYGQWGLTFGVFFMLLCMFVAILYIYISINYNDYYNRINIISNSNWFGRDPQTEFQKYISNTQADAIAVAMNNIKSSSDDIINTSNRINDSTSCLSNQVLTDIRDGSADVNTLGNVLKNQVFKLMDSVNNTISNIYMNLTTNGTSINTISSPNSNTPSPSS